GGAPVAEENVKALVARLGQVPDVHVAQWGQGVGAAGSCWLEDDGRGLWPVRILRSPEHDGDEPQGSLVNPATSEDLERFEKLQEEAEAHRTRAQAAARELGLSMRFIAAELELRDRYLRLLFTAPSRVDFRDLVRRLGQELKLKIELRQVGPRDEARVLGGLGPCGLGVCCRSFLRQLRPIPLEMAFDQQLHISPGRMTGVCGRLMCCLSYEHQQYVEALAKVPQAGSRIEWRGRKGKVTGVNIFHESLSVEWEDGDREELPWHQLTDEGP
ncbi:MAG: regulatory iron-sulfur-containing complex subunit RicT, partial [Candidatus Bipolaricaulota bacterium]